MFNLAAATILSLLASSFALPQYSYSGAAASPPAIHQVTVGGPNGELTFTPNSIAASVGDQVVFNFHQKNHSATQSSLANPCAPVPGGFDSGFMPVAPDATTFPMYIHTVTDTKPIWVYCAQGDGAHCHAGMVFAINCGLTGAANSFASFQAAAEAQGSGSALAPAPTPAAVIPGPDTTTYPGLTVPAPPVAETVTATISLGDNTWTTTYASYPNSPDPTPNSIQGDVITIDVGLNGTLTYTPNRISAKPRDTVVFKFHTKNHTATQSSFEDPCRKLQFTSPTGQVGFDSGFMPVADPDFLPTFNLTVNDTAPIWVYCRQTGHCGMGMVLAINSDEQSGQNIAAFAELAKEINGTTGGSSSSPGSTSIPAASGSMKLSTSMTLSLLGAVVALLL